MWRVLGQNCMLGQGNIIYIHVNVSSKPLDVATSYFAGAWVT